MSEISIYIVDNHMPEWLHIRILTAVDFIWQVKGDDEKTQAMNDTAVAERTKWLTNERRGYDS